MHGYSASETFLCVKWSVKNFWLIFYPVFFPVFKTFGFMKIEINIYSFLKTKQRSRKKMYSSNKS